MSLFFYPALENILMRNFLNNLPVKIIEFSEIFIEATMRSFDSDLDPDINNFLKANGFKHINDINKDGCTALSLAILKEQDKIFKKIVASNKTNINVRDKTGKTAVWWAAHTGNLEYLKLLDEKKADFSIKDKFNSSALFESIQNKFYRAAAYITHRLTGFSIYSDDDSYKQSPLHALCASNTSTPEESEKNIKILNFFKKNNVDLNSVDSNGQTPLMIAAKHENWYMMDWLLDNNCDPSLTDHNGAVFLDHIPQDEISTRNIRWSDFKDKHKLNDEWKNDVESIKKSGHILGIGSFLKLGHRLNLGGQIKMPIFSDEKRLSYTQVYTESWDTKNAFETILENIDSHNKKNNVPEFKVLNEAFEVTNKMMSKMSEEPPGINFEMLREELLKKHRDKKPVIVPMGWSGHDIGLAIYHDKLILTDRFLFSGKHIKECTKILQLNEPIEENIKSILELSKLNQDSEGTKKEIMEMINRVTDHKHPTVRLGDSAQTHGTCVYSNPRSNIEGLLCVIKADQSNTSIQDQKESARQDYLQFLYDTRSAEINKLCKEITERSSQNKKDIKLEMYYNLAESYILGHHNQNKNHGNDWENSISLYRALPENLKERFDKDHKSISKKIIDHIGKVDNIHPSQPIFKSINAEIESKFQNKKNNQMSLPKEEKSTRKSLLYSKVERNSSIKPDRHETESPTPNWRMPFRK